MAEAIQLAPWALMAVAIVVAAALLLQGGFSALDDEIKSITPVSGTTATVAPGDELAARSGEFRVLDNSTTTRRKILIPIADQC
jgi:hypothetical protein